MAFLWKGAVGPPYPLVYWAPPTCPRYSDPWGKQRRPEASPYTMAKPFRHYSSHLRYQKGARPHFEPFPDMQAQAPPHMRGPSRPRAVAFVRKPRCGICTWTATQWPGIRLDRPRHAPEPFLCGLRDALDVVPFVWQFVERAGEPLKKSQRLRPAVSPLILQPDSSGYGAASTVLCCLAVFHSAVLCICQHVVGPLRHQGDHRPQIRRAVDPAGRGRRGARHAMERLRDVKFCKLHAYVSVLGAVPVHASRYAEFTGTDWFGAVRCIVAGHPEYQFAQHGGIYMRYASGIPLLAVRPVELAPLHGLGALGKVLDQLQVGQALL